MPYSTAKQMRAIRDLVSERGSRECRASKRGNQNLGRDLGVKKHATWTNVPALIAEGRSAPERISEKKQQQLMI